MDNIIGKDCELGLASLKTLAETARVSFALRQVANDVAQS